MENSSVIISTLIAFVVIAGALAVVLPDTMTELDTVAYDDTYVADDGEDATFSTGAGNWNASQPAANIYDGNVATYGIGNSSTAAQLFINYTNADTKHRDSYIVSIRPNSTAGIWENYTFNGYVTTNPARVKITSKVGEKFHVYAYDKQTSAWKEGTVVLARNQAIVGSVYEAKIYWIDSDGSAAAYPFASFFKGTGLIMLVIVAGLVLGVVGYFGFGNKK